MRNPKNIAEITKAGADMLGFIFFEKSKRYIGTPDMSYFKNVSYLKEELQRKNMPYLRDMAYYPEKVGVFVNAKEQYVKTKIDEFQLDYVQLHGDESLEYCTKIKVENPAVKIIKVFSVGAIFDFTKTEKYKAAADLFLFDTKGKERGGNGFKFNWDILQEYQGETPFLLSGGISLEDAAAVKAFQHPKLWGIDVNSGFESEPGMKKAHEVQEFVETLHGNV